MKLAGNSTIFSIIALSLLLAAGLVRPAEADSAESERALSVKAVQDLTDLRDQIADQWTAILKGGWNAYLDDKLVFQDVENTLIDFKLWLEAVPPDDRPKMESLTHTMNQLPRAEEVYRASIERCRNSMAQSLLGLIAMTEMGSSVTSKADALVLGVKPPEFIGDLPSDPEALKKLEKFGFKPDPNVGFMVDPPENHKAASVELAELPVGPSGREKPAVEKEPVTPQLVPMDRERRPVEPSSDPEVLRAAYEAYKAYQSLRFMLTPANYDVQLAMAELTTMPARLWYDLQSLEKTLEPIRKLPGLTARELKAVNDLPKYFQETEDNLKSAGDALAQKKQAQADLEELVESALADIDELRACYLGRLAEKGE